MPSLDGPNKLRLGSCWYRAFILAVPSEYIQTSGGPPSMSFPLNSRGAWGGGRGDFRSELRTRAISRSPPRQFLRVTTDFLAVFPSLLSNYFGRRQSASLARVRRAASGRWLPEPADAQASPTPSPPLSLDALDLDGGEENDLDLECVVCCELYDTSVHAPMVLPCSGAHEICRTCVAALRKADGAIQCPKCREDATGAVNPNRGLIAALRLSRRS